MSEQRETPILEIDDVAVHYGGVKAVDGISMRLHAGSIHGIIGPNGSGKSTLVAAITRHVPLTRGRLTLLGRDYTRIAPHGLARLGVGRTFQTVRLVGELSVAENVRLGADAVAGGAPDSRARTRQALIDADLVDQAERRPAELSYGTQRRVEIARAIAMRPRLLLLDEPTAGMNQTERAQVAELLVRLRATGLCQLLIEHDVQMMTDTCDQLFAMSGGEEITTGEPAAVVRHPLVQKAYLGKEIDDACD